MTILDLCLALALPIGLLLLLLVGTRRARRSGTPSRTAPRPAEAPRSSSRMAEAQRPSLRPAEARRPSSRPAPTLVPLVGNAPEGWPAVALDGEPLPIPALQTLALSNALTSAGLRVSHLCPARLTARGVVEPNLQVQDGVQVRDVFFYPEPSPGAAAHFASLRALYAGEGFAEPVYYCRSPLPEARGSASPDSAVGEELGIQKVEAPAGEYAMWWPSEGDRDFTSSRAAALLGALYEKSGPIQSYVAGFLLNRLGVIDELSRVGLPERKTYGVQGPEGEVFVLQFSKWHGIRFAFDPSRTPPAYRDRFLAAFLRLVEVTERRRVEQALPKDPEEHPSPRQWWSRTRREAEESEQDPGPVGVVRHGILAALPGFSPAELERFLDVLQEVVAREGGELDRGAGTFTLAGTPGVFGLKNAAELCRTESPEKWPDIAREWVVHMRTKPRESVPASWEEARPLLAARVRPERFQLKGAACRNDLPGMITLLEADLPTAVHSLRWDTIDGWGRSREEVWRVALDNLVERHPISFQEDEFPGFGGLPYRVFTAAGADFFTSSHALVLDRHPEAHSPYGCLVALPTRHHLLVYPVDPATVMQATQGLCSLCQIMHDDEPGSLDPDVFLWRDGRFSRLRSERRGATHELHPPEEYLAMLEEIARDAKAPPGGVGSRN